MDTAMTQAASNVVQLPTTAIPTAEDYSFARDAEMRALIKRQYAADLTDDEFTIFLDVCRVKRLDPRQGHIHAWVFSKDDPIKRRICHYTAITGLRSIADRTGTYLASDVAPEFTRCEKTLANPAGIESVIVRVKKYGRDGQYHDVVGEAYWEEYAPIRVPSAQFEGDKPDPPYLDPNSHWKRMPRLMLAKVAEAVALRKGWPDELAGFYADEELAQAKLEDRFSRPVITKVEPELVPGELPSKDVRADMVGVVVESEPVRELVREPVQPLGEAIETVPADQETADEPTYRLNLLNGQGPIDMTLDRFINFANRFIDRYAESDPARVVEFNEVNRCFAAIWEASRSEKLKLSRRIEECAKQVRQGEAANNGARPDLGSPGVKRGPSMSERARPTARRPVPLK
jgi:phage recombination protein Bet